MLHWVLLAYLQQAPPAPKETPSLFDQPAFRESKLEPRVDSGAHASASSTARGAVIPPLEILELPPVPERSRSTNPQARADHDEAVHLETQGKPLEAAALFARAAEADASTQHLRDAALQLLAHGASARAAKLLDRALQQAPDDATLCLARGLAHMALAQFDAARQLFLATPDPRAAAALEFLLESSPEQASLLAEQLAAHPYLQAIALLRVQPPAAQATSRAVTLLRQAIAAGQRPARAHLELARIAQDQQRAEDATRELEAAVKLDPDLEIAHLRLAQLYQRGGQRQKAAVHFAAYRKLHEARLLREESQRKARIVFADP